jgi:hypothetical protein
MIGTFIPRRSGGRRAAPSRVATPRLLVASLSVALLGAAAFVAAPRPLAAQTNSVVAGGDFDICDGFGGTLRGKTAFFRGRPGFGTEREVFAIVNGATSDQDCGRDGYTPGVDFQNLIVSDTTDFRNVDDPSRVILKTNLVIADFLNPVKNGLANDVNFYVNVPNGTPAGIYRGSFTVRDTVNAIGLNANGEALRVDVVYVEIEVLASRGFGLVQGDTNATATALLLSGRPGQTVSGVVRVANLGNVALENTRVDITDLVATSGTGLRIRSDRISVSPATLTSVAIGDTARLTVTVRIPTGILAGDYRGDLTVQTDQARAITIPITVRVTTPGDLVFETNPVSARGQDNAIIIFNADPGTKWDMAIFDMMGLTTYKTLDREVFAGTPGTTAGGGGFPGDQAVREPWNLKNNRGEQVAGGMYYVIVNAVQDGKRRQLRGKLMVIR